MAEKSDIEKRLEKQIKDLEAKLAGVGKLPSVAEPEVEKAEINLSDDELDKIIKDSVKGAGTNPAKPEDYICGNCGYVAQAPFSPCPKCNAKLSW